MTVNYCDLQKSSTDRKLAYRETLSKAGGISPSQLGGGNGGDFQFFGGDAAEKKQRSAYEQFKSWVFVCANYLAKRVASQPILAGEQINAEANPVRRPDGRWYSSKGVQMVRSIDFPHLASKSPGADVEVISEHAALDVLCRPNYLQGSFEFRYLSVINLLLTGEAYWIMDTVADPDTEGGQRLEMWVLPTHWIKAGHRDGPYTSFKLQPPNVPGEGMPLKPENVIRTYLANPVSLTGVWSPLHAIMRASNIDDHLQHSQEQMFSRGINPNVILTIADRRGIDGKPTGSKPTLTGDQRRQMVRAVREVWGSTMNMGDPAIIDGMIAGIHKLNSAPAEMDWMNSEQINKPRIMQAFGVNPIVVGEIVGANRAQAVTAEASVAENTINPLASAISSSMTDRIGPLYTDPERLLIWIQPCSPVDTDLRDKRWLAGHKQGVVDDNEIRSELYGLTPKEDEVVRNAILNSHTGMAQTLAVVTAYSDGKIPRDSAIAMLMVFLEIEEVVATELVGEEREPVVPALPMAPGVEPDDDDKPEDGPKPESDDKPDPEAEVDDEPEGKGLMVLSDKFLGVMEEIKTVRDSGDELTQGMTAFASRMAAAFEKFTQEHEAKLAVMSSRSGGESQVVVNVPLPVVNLNPEIIVERSEPEITIEAPVVNVEAPQVTVEAAEIPPTVVNVEVPEIKFSPEINVEAKSDDGERVTIVEHEDGSKSVIRSSVKK